MKKFTTLEFDEASLKLNSGILIAGKVYYITYATRPNAQEFGNDLAIFSEVIKIEEECSIIDVEMEISEVIAQLPPKWNICKIIAVLLIN
jgi:hypothetical protein